jgi:hypothetical protein
MCKRLRKKSICGVAEILRHCGVPDVRLISQAFRALHMELFAVP